MHKKQLTVIEQLDKEQKNLSIDNILISIGMFAAIFGAIVVPLTAFFGIPAPIFCNPISGLLISLMVFLGLIVVACECYQQIDEIHRRKSIIDIIKKAYTTVKKQEVTA